MSNFINKNIQNLAGVATILGTVYFIFISLDRGEPQINIKNTDPQVIYIKEEGDSKLTSPNIQSTHDENSSKTIGSDKSEKGLVTKISSTSNVYIANKSANTSGVIDIVVAIQDEYIRLSDELINGVSDYYISNGYNSKYNIFSNDFFSKGLFTDLYNGQLSIIAESELERYCDKIAIGKMTCSYSQNSFDPTMTTADANLYIKVISISNQRIEKSVVIHGVNTGWSKDEARANTLKEILSQLSSKL